MFWFLGIIWNRVSKDPWPQEMSAIYQKQKIKKAVNKEELFGILGVTIQETQIWVIT